MTDTNQKQLGNTLWSIADQLRGAMDADDFRDYMLSFLFLRYLSDNYETAAKKELGKDYPDVGGDTRKVPLALWYANNPDDIGEFEKQMRRKVHYVIKPQHLWSSIANMARTQSPDLLDYLQGGFKYIETESFESTFQGLFSEIDLSFPQAGQEVRGPERQALHHPAKDRRRAGRLLHRHRRARRRLRIPDRSVRRRVRQEGGRVLHPAADFRHPLRHRHAGQPGAEDRAQEAAR